MEKLQLKLNDFCRQFPYQWESQKYLWKSVRTFQNNWDLEADDLAGMIDMATVDADYLLFHEPYYCPRKMIIGLAKRDAQEVRVMFKDLFDERRDLIERSRKFNQRADELRKKYKGHPFDRNYQYMNAVSTYLWLRYPEKYYFYKHRVASKVSQKTGIAYASQRDPVENKMVSNFALLDQVSTALRGDDRFREMLNARLDETMYPDNQMHCMAMAFAFFLRSCYEGSKNGIK
ncbi:MAG: hypothetical protein Q4A32_02040 [Lachnospiraceae bacterium]|nr:hypothetical protein [Lachnospiraceae bacterium]